jgi:hypothetical protein
LDPFTFAAISGAVSGMAGKALELITDIAKKTLFSRFKEHSEATQERANANMEDLVAKIEAGFQRLETSNATPQHRIDQAIRSPSAAILVQSALFNGMTLDNENKRVLLARLVIERLQSESESILSLASEQACYAIARSTPTGLRILGLKSTLDRLAPDSSAPLKCPKKVAKTQLKWVISLLSPYKTLSYSDLDMLHLRAISCVTGRSGMLAPGLMDYVSSRGRLQFKVEDFEANEVGAYISHLWRYGLVNADLTSVGLLVGIYVSDILRKTTTDLSAWR